MDSVGLIRKWLEEEGLGHRITYLDLVGCIKLGTLRITVQGERVLVEDVDDPGWGEFTTTIADLRLTDRQALDKLIEAIKNPFEYRKRNDQTPESR